VQVILYGLLLQLGRQGKYAFQLLTCPIQGGEKMSHFRFSKLKNPAGGWVFLLLL